MMRLLALSLLLTGSAAAQTTTTSQVVVPSLGGFAAAVMSGSANQLRCLVFPMPFGITGATKLTFGVVATGGTCAVGLYPDDDNGSVLLGSSLVCTSAGAKVTTTSPSVNLTQGALYRLCMCSSSTATTIETIEETARAGMKLADIFNVSSVRVGTGTDCTAGALPPTTGALSAAIFKPAVAVIE